MPKVVAIIQARLTSQRFPAKILADLDGQPILAWVLQRAREIRGVDAVALAMPGVTARAESDVLGRFLDVARAYRADVIMRLTADCPLLDRFVAEQVLELYRSRSCDFASNDTLISGFPDGWDVEVFSRAALETAAANATEPHDREHVTSWMRRTLRCQTLYAQGQWTGPKLSIDTPEDLETVRAWLHDQRRKTA